MVTKLLSFDVIFNKKDRELFGEYLKIKKMFEDYWINKLNLDEITENCLKEQIKIIKKFLNIPPNYDVRFSFGTTDAIERIFQRYIQDGDNIVITTRNEHDSVESDFNGLKGIFTNQEYFEFKDLKELKILTKEISKRGFLNKKVLFILSHVFYDTGEAIDIYSIIQEIKKNFKNSFVIVDGVHAFGNIQINIDQVAPDAYVFDLYKWANGLEGQGFCIIKKNHPYIKSFDSIYGSNPDILSLNNYKRSWRLNPLLVNWLANTYCLNKIEKIGIDNIIENNKILSNIFYKSFIRKKLILNHSTAMFSIDFGNGLELYNYLLSRGFLTHYIPDKKYVRFCFNSLLSKESEVKLLVKVLNEYFK